MGSAASLENRVWIGIMVELAIGAVSQGATGGCDMNMMRSMLAGLSSAGARAKLQVLIFHRVRAIPDPLFPGEIDAQQFDRLCTWLKHWFNVLPLDQAAALMQSGGLPGGALAISFDDGYADNHEIALPILQRHGLKATFFIATAFLNGGRMWNDSVIEATRLCKAPVLDLTRTVAASLGVLAVESLPDKQAAIGRLIGAIKYLPPQERTEWVNAIIALQNAGMQIGAHTANHQILAKLSRSRARQEIAASKQALEAMLGRKIDLFAYPNGKPGTDYSAETVELVRELGFAAAFTTVAAANTAASDPFQLARYTPWERTRLRFGAKLMENYLRQ